MRGGVTDPIDYNYINDLSGTFYIIYSLGDVLSNDLKDSIKNNGAFSLENAELTLDELRAYITRLSHILDEVSQYYEENHVE